MSAPERNKHSVREGDKAALRELDGFTQEGRGGNTPVQDHGAAGETAIDPSILAEGALRQGGD